MDSCLVKLRHLQSLENTFIKDEANDLLITEFAETLARFVFIIDEKLDENLLYEIMNCSFPAI
jgi:hypothetical protein